MAINNLGDLVVELVSNGLNCVYVSKFDQIFFNDEEYKEFTVSIYMHKEKKTFQVGVNTKGTKYADQSKTQRKACLDLKNDLIVKLNSFGIYNFGQPSYVTAVTPVEKTTTQIDDNDPFKE